MEVAGSRPDLDPGTVQRVIAELSEPTEYRLIFGRYDEITSEEAAKSLPAIAYLGKCEDFGPAANLMGTFLFGTIRRVLQRRAEGLPAVPEAEEELAAFIDEGLIAVLDEMLAAPINGQPVA